MVPSDERCSSAGSSLPLMLVNEGRADDASLDIAKREAEATWVAAGLHLVWTTPEMFGGSSPYPGVFVVIRPDFLPGGSVSRFEASQRGRHVLGRVMFIDGSPRRLIEVSMRAIRTSVREVHAEGPRSAAFLRVAGRGVVGRALGRVIAHEIGHWLFGRKHTEAGLMKPSLYPHDLIRPKALALPRGWSVAEVEHLRALHSRCAIDDRRASSKALMQGAAARRAPSEARVRHRAWSDSSPS